MHRWIWRSHIVVSLSVQAALIRPNTTKIFSASTYSAKLRPHVQRCCIVEVRVQLIICIGGTASFGPAIWQFRGGYGVRDIEEKVDEQDDNSNSRSWKGILDRA